MDVASLALGIGALAETAAKVVEYLHDVKDGGKQRIRLSAEIGALWSVLENVKEQVEGWSITSNAAARRYLEALSRPNGALEQCSTILSKVYEKCQPRNGVKAMVQSLKWPFGKEEISRVLESVRRLTASINLTYAQVTVAVLEDVADSTTKTHAAIDCQETQAMLDWISHINFTAQHAQMFLKWCPGTIIWYLKTPGYRDWVEGHNPLLWTCGLAGAGKSILASLVINDLTAIELTRKSAVLGIYFDPRTTGEDSDVIVEILASLLKQLVLKLGASDELRRLYRANATTRRSIHLSEVLDNMDALLQRLDRVFLVADGIDEMPTQRLRASFFAGLRSLKAISKISIMLVSRPDLAIEQLLAPLHHVCDICDTQYLPKLYHCENHEDGGFDICESCYAEGNVRCRDPKHDDPVLLDSSVGQPFNPQKEDIELYVRFRLSEHEIWDRLQKRKDGLLQELVDKIVASAELRFLIAQMHTDNLHSFDTMRDICTALARPLGSLKAMYDEALERLLHQRPDRVRLAKETLKWITTSHGDLRASELAQAVQYSLDPQHFDVGDAVSSSKLVELCAGITTFYYNGDVGFVHFSAQEHFGRLVNEWFPDRHNDVARSCLSFLLRDEFKEDWHTRLSNGSQSLMSTYPLHRHASKYWTVPLKKGTAPSEASRNLALTFLRSREELRTARLSASCHDTQIEHDPELSTLHLAVYSCVPDLVKHLLQTKDPCNINATDMYNRTPLHLAAKHGQPSMVEALLSVGACTDKISHRGFTPLLSAVRAGYGDVVHALLFHTSKNVADVNLASDESKTWHSSRTPLMLAARQGDPATMRIILKHPDLQVNRMIYGKTALHICINHGYVECVQLLTQDARCDLNLARPSGFTPLEVAMYFEHLDIITILLKSGATKEYRDPYGFTPLLHAAMRDQVQSVKCLLQNGCTIFVEDSVGRNILHHAAAAEAGFVLAYMLEEFNGPWRHELQIFNASELIDIDKLLNKGDSLGSTPLLVALQRGLVRNAQLLCDYGADPDIANHSGTTAREWVDDRLIDIKLLSLRSAGSGETGLPCRIRRRSLPC